MKKLFILILAIFSVSASYAQNILKGTVRGTEDNEPIVGATVSVEGTTRGTVTDVNGDYELRVNTGELILFTYVGMTAAKEIYTGQQRIDMLLSSEVTQLDQVVVVGYGVQKKSLVTGAISSVSEKDMKRPGLLRADDVLQGRAAGVQVFANSGQPGEGLSVRIRGIGTNDHASPLYIVDGQPMDDIGFLNPRDIASMEVLKDAASSAIFGSRGANGVVILTTRKGKMNEAMRIEVDCSYGVQNLRKKMDLLDARSYAIIQNEAAINGGRDLLIPLDELPKLGKGTDWQKEILYKNAPIQNYQVSLTGGAKNSAFAVSASYLNQDGIFAKNKSNFERTTIRESGDYKYLKNDILKVGQSVAITFAKSKGIDPNNVWGGPILGALNMDPITPVRDADGKFAESPYVSQEVVNPLAKIAITNKYYKYTRILANAYGELTLLKDFKLRSTIAAEINFDDDWIYTPVYRLNSAQFNDEAGTHKATSWYKIMTYENTLTYTKEFGKHDISAMIGNTLKKDKGNNLGGSKKGMLIDDPKYGYLDLAKNENSKNVWGGAWHRALVSYFGRLNYAYDGKYMLTATFRADGSTYFGPNNRFGYFPSVSVGWNISQEKFMSDIKQVDFLKLRASWGQNGNDQIGDWQYLATVDTRARSYIFGGEMVSGASPNKIANPDLKWETSEQLNFGFDLGFLNKFTLTADYYVKKTKDLLVIVPIPLYVGTGAPFSNAGNVRNTGFEISLGYNDFRGDWRWSANLNLSYNKNKVTYVGTENKSVSGSSVGTAMTDVTRMQEGHPISFFWGFETAGIFQNQAEVDAYIYTDPETGAVNKILPNAQPGDFRFVDRNNDGMIDDKDRVQIGKPNPDFTFGLSLGFSWKNLDFSTLLVGMTGNDIFNATRRWDLPGSNYHKRILNRWHGEGTSNTHPRVTASDANRNYSLPSKYFIEDGSFLRMKNITLGYTFNNLGKYYVQKIRLYVSATNLFTWTKYSGLDPEIGTGNVLGAGIDYGIYPQPRTYTFGATFTF